MSRRDLFRTALRWIVGAAMSAGIAALCRRRCAAGPSNACDGCPVADNCGIRNARRHGQ